MGLQEKECKICKQLFPLDYFSSNIKSKDGKLQRCKKCLSNANREKRQNLGLKVKPIVPILGAEEYFCTKCENIRNYSEMKKACLITGNKFGQCNNCIRKQRDKKRREAGVKIRGVSNVGLTEEGYKKCLFCLQILPLDKFYAEKLGHAGLSTYCKDCKNKIRRTRYKDKNKEWAKKFRESCPDYKQRMIRYEHEKRARLLNASTGTVTKEFLEGIYSQEICTYCKKFVAKSKRTLDHIVALTKGGLHDVSNLVMCCYSCNCRKNNLDLNVFLQRLEKER